MQQAGYDCMGVTMKLYENEDAGVPRGHTCCTLDDVEDARRVAYALGMPYYVFNYKDAFREQVMARFATAYQHGATPNPCLDCNRYLCTSFGNGRRQKNADSGFRKTGLRTR